MSPSSSWFTENYTPFDARRHKLRRILVQKRTRFQKVMLADSYSFGRCLILDGELQSAERDEFIYHEALVHPAMMLHPRPRRVLILGGGEGATAREILRHASVQQVTMVDIDGEVVAFCQKHLRSWHRGSFEHPKTRLLVGDAKRFIETSEEKFDVIFSDLPTPSTAKDPVAALYTTSFYKRLRLRLLPGGKIVVQSGSGHPFHMEFHARLSRILHAFFKTVSPYFTFIPSFDEPWSFLLASSGQNPLKISSPQVNKRLGNLSKHLRFYDGQTHESIFKIPKHIRAK